MLRAAGRVLMDQADNVDELHADIAKCITESLGVYLATGKVIPLTITPVFAQDGRFDGISLDMPLAGIEIDTDIKKVVAAMVPSIADFIAQDAAAAVREKQTPRIPSVVKQMLEEAGRKGMSGVKVINLGNIHGGCGDPLCEDCAEELEAQAAANGEKKAH